MTFMAEMISAAARKGYIPLCASNGKTLRTFMCPKCSVRKLVIFESKKGRKKYKACPCGHKETA